MSYDYFLFACQNTEPAQIPTNKILAIVEDYIVRKDESFIDLEFDKSNHCTFYLDTNLPTNDGLNIHRPCASEQFVRCIYDIMKLGNFVFYEPDGKHAIIIDPETERHMPPDMIESLGKPMVAVNWESFQILFWNNR